MRAGLSTAYLCGLGSNEEAAAWKTINQEAENLWHRRTKADSWPLGPSLSLETPDQNTKNEFCNSRKAQRRGVWGLQNWSPRAGVSETGWAVDHTRYGSLSGSGVGFRQPPIYQALCRRDTGQAGSGVEGLSYAPLPRNW